MKYIDADRLRAEIERRIYDDYNTGEHEIDDIAQGALAGLIPFIASLQQEQPEVELEREIRDYFSKWDYDFYNRVITTDNDTVATLSSIQNVARHFWNKGFNARKEK